jgi:hypothetical protein
MVNTRAKQHNGDMIIKRKLGELGFTNLYSFPHMRFSKDYNIGEAGFDCIGWRNGNFTDRKMLHLFQFKATKDKAKPSKKMLAEYKNIEREHFCKCIWVNKVDRDGIYWYDIQTGLKGTKL